MKKLLLTFALGFVFNLAFAQQDSKFEVEVSSDSVLLGNYFEVKFKLENVSGTHFEPPSFEGFRLVGGPNQSSSFSMVNGKVTQSMSYSYYLEPLEIGFFYIEPASVKVGNEIVETLPKKILVVENPEELNQSDSRNQDELNPFNRRTPKPKKPKKKRKIYKL